MTDRSCDLKGTQKVFFLHLNQATSCCRATPVQLNNQNPISVYTNQWQDEKQQLADGHRLPGCEVCWRDEDASRLSYRQLSQDRAIRNVIELTLNNLCNHMCSYCSPKFSSQWEDSIRSHGQFVNISNTAKANLATISTGDHTQHWIDQIETYINSQPDGSVDIKLLGGEPLMQQRNLERLLKLSGDKIGTLSVHTNLNPPNNKFLLWLLDTVPTQKLHIDISIDATPGYNHVPRAGFDQLKFEENLQQLKNYNVEYWVASVSSVLSIFDSANFINWNRTLGHPVKYSRVHNPACLDPTLLPYDLRQTILHSMTDPPLLFQDILNDPTEPNKLQLLEQYNYLTQYFNRVNISTNTINNELFQHWWNWLKTTNERISL
jgi:organic radical activating enzyme